MCVKRQFQRRNGILQPFHFRQRRATLELPLVGIYKMCPREIRVLLNNINECDERE